MMTLFMVAYAPEFEGTIAPSFVKMKELLTPGHMCLSWASGVLSAVAYASLLTAGHSSGLGDLE